MAESKSMWRRWMDWAIPAALREGDPETQRQARLVVYMSLIIAGAAASYASIYLFLQMFITASEALFAFALASGVLFSFRHHGRVGGARTCSPSPPGSRWWG